MSLSSPFVNVRRMLFQANKIRSSSELMGREPDLHIQWSLDQKNYMYIITSQLICKQGKCVVKRPDTD